MTTTTRLKLWRKIRKGLPLYYNAICCKKCGGSLPKDYNYSIMLMMHKEAEVHVENMILKTKKESNMLQCFGIFFLDLGNLICA